jgi:hypothetical protein
MQRLDAPVPPDQAGELGGAGLVGGEVGDAERGDRAGRRAGGVGDVAFDQSHLLDVREREIGRGGADLDGAGGDPSVAVVDLPVGDRDFGPGQRVERGEQGGLILFRASTAAAHNVNTTATG